MCKRNKTLAKTHQWQTKWRYNVLDVFFEFNAANISKRKEKQKQNKLLTKQNEPLQCQIFATWVYDTSILSI